MTVHPTQRKPMARPTQDEWNWRVPDEPEPARQRGRRAALVFLVILALAVPLAAAFVLVKLFFPGSPSTTMSGLQTETLLLTSTSVAHQAPTGSAHSVLSGTASVTVTPSQGTIDTLVTVEGQGWWPGEPVFIFLRSLSEGDGPGYSYAADVADDEGMIQTAFTFPNEARWVGQSSAEVMARGTNSGMEAVATFVLLLPTPTDTSPPPTPTSTRVYNPTPTATVNTPTPEPVINDWRGEYFANQSLTGEPVLVRNDVFVDFDWGEGSPAPGLPEDGFGARWSRRWTFDEGVYRFTLAADDGVRFWIDGQLLVDEWHDGPFEFHSLEVYLPPGERSLQLEYYEHLGQAAVLLSWTLAEPSTPTPTPSPTASLTITPTPTGTPTPTPTSTPTPLPTSSPPPPAWTGEYYDNAKLVGKPVVVRADAELSFDWGSGSPDPLVPVDYFSVRWSRNVPLPAGTYRVSLDVDDGVRLWIDGMLLIDEWHESGGQRYDVDVDLPEGVHAFQVDFLEMALDAHVRFSMHAVSGQRTDGGRWRP